MSLRIGIDIGSTTVKVVLLDEQNKLLFRSYERHYSKARERAAETLRSLADRLAGRQVRIVITGSAGLGVAKAAEIDFVQEVYATAAAVNQYIPDTDAVIELGGEDAKIIFFGGALEERMNGSCAGGTGAFIDQMATLMNVTVNELDELSLKHEKITPSPPAAASLPRATSSPSSTRAAGRRTWRPLSSRPWWIRRWPASPRAGSSRARSSSWAAPSTSSWACGSASWRP